MMNMAKLFDFLRNGNKEHQNQESEENELSVDKLIDDGVALLESDDRKQQKKGFFKLRAAALLGDMRAIYYEGICYKDGCGIYQSYDQAFNRFHESARAIPEAMYWLGLFYLDGVGTEQNLLEAFSCFLRAADAGLPEAQYELGVCYRQGEGTVQDIEKALYWYQKAAEQGCSAAYVNMGIIYQAGVGGIPVDYKKGFECFQKASTEDNPEAFFCLGKAYLNGLGVGQNLNEAARWFKKAADFGEPDSMYHLGMMYRDGIGVEPNEAISEEYFSKAENIFRKIGIESGDENLAR